jgi:hypothetical protein
VKEGNGGEDPTLGAGRAVFIVLVGSTLFSMSALIVVSFYARTALAGDNVLPADVVVFLMSAAVGNGSVLGSCWRRRP